MIEINRGPMKNKSAFLALALMLALGFVLPSSAQSRFGLKIGGGLGYLDGGDVNAGYQGLSDLYREILSLIPHTTFSGRYEPFHLGMDFNGEIFYQVSPEIAIGLGVGVLTATRESSMTLTDGHDSSVFYWKPTVKAIPVTLNFHYFVPVAGGVKLVLSAGAGVFIAGFDMEQTFFSDESNLMETSAVGFGGHGGLGLEIELTKSLSLTLDLLGRYARVGGLTGTWSDEPGAEGKLWYLDATIEGEGPYPMVILDEGIPSGEGAVMENVREAKLGLSGFSAVIGFLFRI